MAGGVLGGNQGPLGKLMAAGAPSPAPSEPMPEAKKEYDPVMIEQIIVQAKDPKEATAKLLEYLASAESMEDSAEGGEPMPPA